MTERNFCAAHIYENLLGMEHALGAGGSQAGRGEAYREQSGRLEQNLQDMAVMAVDSERLIGYVQQIDGFQRSQSACGGRRTGIRPCPPRWSCWNSRSSAPRTYR